MLGQHRTTAGTDYTSRLTTLSGARWKRVLDVQAPYRWNLRRLLGDRRVLDVGCGIGRNLAHLPAGSIGVDHNPHSVEICRQHGLPAQTVTEFFERTAAEARGYTGLLAAHLLEHLTDGGAVKLLGSYLPYLDPGARIVLICPQPRGYASDPTHTVYLDHAALRSICELLGLAVERELSFPLPRWAGRWFTYNEWITVARLGGRGDS